MHPIPLAAPILQHSVRMGLKHATSCIEMIGFGFRSLRDSQDKLMRDKAMNGLTIRIISMNPDSPFLAQREKDEKVSAG